MAEQFLPQALLQTLFSTSDFIPTSSCQRSPAAMENNRISRSSYTETGLLLGNIVMVAQYVCMYNNNLCNHWAQPRLFVDI